MKRKKYFARKREKQKNFRIFFSKNFCANKNISQNKKIKMKKIFARVDTDEKIREEKIFSARKKLSDTENNV